MTPPTPRVSSALRSLPRSHATVLEAQRFRAVPERRGTVPDALHVARNREPRGSRPWPTVEKGDDGATARATVRPHVRRESRHERVGAVAQPFGGGPDAVALRGRDPGDAAQGTGHGGDMDAARARDVARGHRPPHWSDGLRRHGRNNMRDRCVAQGEFVGVDFVPSVWKGREGIAPHRERNPR